MMLPQVLFDVDGLNENIPLGVISQIVGGSMGLGNEQRMKVPAKEPADKNEI